jgi:hypothetical protein
VSVKFLPLLTALCALVLLTGCASTKVVSQDPGADIYLDDRWIGVGEAKVGRVGPPRHATLEARKGGKTVGRADMARSFRFMTVVWGAVSYYTGFYWGWYYPESVMIPVLAPSQAKAIDAVSPWMKPRESVWMKPLN